MTKKLFVFCVLVLAAAGSLSACENTAQGFGRDMENTGKNIQKAVD